MSFDVKEDWVNCLFSKPQGKTTFERKGFRRIEESLPLGCSKKVDIHTQSGLQVHFVQVAAGDGPDEIVLFGEGEVIHFLHSAEMGFLVRIRKEGMECTAWFPPNAGQFCFDAHNRISGGKSPTFSYQWEFYPQVFLRVRRPEIKGNVGVIPYVVIEDSTGQIFDELANLKDVERCLYLKSEWFAANVPSDIWKYFINGSVYDPRSDQKIGKRFRCQQCAYAWWTYFYFLYQRTQKKIYDLMQDQIAYSVLMELSPNGEWGHGFWSDDMETHARFHLDGLHLLLSQYDKTQNSMWLKGAECGTSFLFSHLMDRLDHGGVWFLHDTLELTSKAHQFQSSLFGKKQGNSLTINTHVRALTVLHRLRKAIPQESKYTDMLEKGMIALRNVLEYKSGELFYRRLMPWIVKNSTWTDCPSIVSRILRGLEARIIKTFYRILRRRFPRFVQPGGFIERDLTLTLFFHPYQIINLKDFLYLYKYEKFPWLRPYIEEGTALISEYVQKLEVKNALKISLIYVELIDVLYLCNQLIGGRSHLGCDSLENQIYQEIGGYSLDYYVLKTGYHE